jgi:Mn-dependent DtxR family transcriptional regulator
MAVKAPNYSAEAEVRIREIYSGKDNAAEVAQISAELGKSPASVRAKLSSMGLYVKAEKAVAAKSATKFAIAEKIGKQAGLQEFEVEGLAKATKGSLTKILAALVN